MKARGWALTDVGRKRDHNEDSFLCNDEIGLYAVADGMGGHLGGERASRMAIEILEDEIGRGIALGEAATGDPATSDTLPPGAASDGQAAGAKASNRIVAALRKAVTQATKTIWEQSQRDPEYTGMGTTLTGLLFHADRASIVHVGDSRAYLYRNGQARQLTDDHSWIAEQVRAGLLAPDDVMTSRFRNIITRSVGFEPTVNPDVITIPVEIGDCFLLCSDGLANHVTVEEIGQILSSRFYREGPQAFVDLANQRGGEDNVTVLTIYAGNQEKK